MRTARVLLLVCVLALLASCGGQTGVPTIAAPSSRATPSVTAEGTVISFGVWEYEVAQYAPLAERFNTENPGSTVVVVPIDEVYNTSSGDPLATLRAAVSFVDTSVAYGLPSAAYNTPLLLDLRPFMESDATFARDDFFPGALDRYASDTGVWALPRSFYVPLLNYNQTLFAEAGVPEPTSAWTWAELLATAEQFARKRGTTIEQYGWLDPSSGFLPLLGLLQQQQIDPLQIAPAELRLTDPAYLDAARALQKLYVSGALVNPYGMASGPGGDGGGGQPFDGAETVRSGRAAIWGDIGVTDAEGKPLQLDFARRIAYPVGSATALFGGAGDGLIISGGTAYPEASWRWIEWLSRQPIEVSDDPTGGLASGRIPARRSVADQVAFWRDLDPQSVAAYEAALSRASADATTFDNNVLGAFASLANRVTSDPTTDIAKAATEAQRELDASLLMAQGATPTPRVDTGPVTVATPEPQTAPAGATPITFGIYGYSSSEIRPILRAFRETNPDIFVTLEPFGALNNENGMVDDLFATLAQGSDCFISSDRPTAANEQLVLDLQPLLDGDSNIPADDFFPAMLSPYQRGGALLGLPYAASLRTLGYNTTLFDTAGVKPPSAAWKLDDLLSNAQALTSGNGDQKTYGYVSLNGPLNDLVFFAGRAGGGLTTGDLTALRPDFTNPKTIAGIQFYLDLARVHGVMPAPALNFDREAESVNDLSYDLVRQGKAGMWLDFGIGMASAGAMGDEGAMGETDFVPAIAPLPLGGGGLRADDLFTRGLYISAQASAPEACWQLLSFFTSQPQFVYSDVPARESLATSPEFQSEARADTRAVFNAYRDVLRVPGEAPQSNQAVLYSPQFESYWLLKALNAHLTKQTDLATELAAAQTVTTAFAECVAAKGKPPTCARQVDPTYRGFLTDEPGIE